MEWQHWDASCILLDRTVAIPEELSKIDDIFGTPKVQEMEWADRSKRKGDVSEALRCGTISSCGS
jgi:hypothetical protein